MKEIRILIIEDDPMVVDINRKVVQEVVGYKVVGTAKNGEQALEMCLRLKPNLIILDIFMPQQNGLEFLKEMRKHTLDADVIMVTASQDLLHLKEGMRYGVVDYIVKPFRLERLKTALENYRRTAYALEGKNNLCQGDIDSMMKRCDTEKEVPKGLSEYTLNIIRKYLSENHNFYTSDEIADTLGLARVTVRRYLEFLTSKQEAEMNLEYGNIGRPLKKYRKIVYDQKE